MEETTPKLVATITRSNIDAPILQAVSTIQEPDENKKAAVGMDAANKKGLDVLVTKGPEAMFAHMVKESGSRMMAMYH
jgi:hypothetical protein